MASQNLSGGMWVPILRRQDPALNASTYLMDATSEQAVLVFRAPKAGNLQGFGAYFGAVGNQPNNGLKFSFQSVSLTTGLSTGTILGATNGAHATTAANTPNAAGWTDPGNFSEVAAVSRGDLLAAVIAFSSFSASDSVTVGGLVVNNFVRGFPYGLTVTGTKNTNVVPIFGIRYDDGTYVDVIHDVWAVTGLNSTSINTGTTPDEMGMAFQVPFPCTLKAVMVTLQVAAGANYDIVVYDSDGTTALTTQSVDGDLTSSTATVFHEHYLDADVSLLANTTYRVVIKPTTATSLVFMDHSFQNLALMDTSEGGSAWYLTARTDAGAWTNYNSGTFRKPRISLLLNGFDDATGGGGGSAGGAHIFGGTVIR
jgi:hypothetical protein